MLRLRELLQPKHLTSIIDVGASDMEKQISGAAWYKLMVDHQLARVTGFDPQADCLPVATEGRNYLPIAVGSGKPATLYQCAHPAFTGLFEPDEKILALFADYTKWGKVQSKTAIETHRIDDIDEIDNMDFLVMDAQGSELDILNGATEKLKSTAVIQVEMSFIPLYKNQPMFADLDAALRHLGFIPHTIAGQVRQVIAPFHQSKLSVGAKVNQNISLDMVYIRDFARLDKLEPEVIKHLAMIVYYSYQSFDLAFRCVDHLHKRGIIQKPKPRAAA